MVDASGAMRFDQLAHELAALHRHQQSCFRLVNPQEFVSGQGFLRAGKQETFNVIQAGVQRIAANPSRRSRL